MPIPDDQITHRKLILVKQLYQHAVEQSASQHSIVRRIISVIIFDLAIETVLNAVVGSLNPQKTPSDNFGGLIDQADDLLTKRGYNPVPDKANIRRVHSIRNDAQHKAKYPNETDVSDCRTYTRDFLQNIVNDVWGLSFEKVSLTDIVQHQEVKGFLVNAETALGQGQYRQAVQQAAAGLTLALESVERAVVGPIPSFPKPFVMGDNPEYLETDLSPWDVLESMRETLLYTALGMNFGDYMQYKQIAGNVYFVLSGAPRYQAMKAHIDASDAEFVVAYCINTVVEIESLAGSLDAPFGLDRRQHLDNR